MIRSRFLAETTNFPFTAVLLWNFVIHYSPRLVQVVRHFLPAAINAVWDSQTSLLYRRWLYHSLDCWLSLCSSFAVQLGASLGRHGRAVLRSGMEDII